MQPLCVKFFSDCRTTNDTETTWKNGTSIHVPVPDKNCVFPYSFLGKTYEECTLDHFHDFWCGTDFKVTDRSGWGLCGDGCQKDISTGNRN